MDYGLRDMYNECKKEDQLVFGSYAQGPTNSAQV